MFLDRDGTIMEEVGFCGDPALVAVYPGVREAMEKLHQAGFLMVVITNQSGIGHGYFTDEQYQAVHEELVRQLEPVRIDGVYYCADAPENAGHRRKPNPGMVFEAAADLDIDLPRSYFVGDRAGDIECGRNAGTRTVLVETGYGLNAAECTPDYRARDLVDAVEWILRDAR